MPPLSCPTFESKLAFKEPNCCWAEGPASLEALDIDADTELTNFAKGFVDKAIQKVSVYSIYS
jgi:hypothetical protein